MPKMVMVIIMTVVGKSDGHVEDILFTYGNSSEQKIKWNKNDGNHAWYIRQNFGGVFSV